MRFSPLLLLSSVVFADVDSTIGSSEEPIKSVGFGSCAKQGRDQSFWPLIVSGGASRRPLQAWFWLGDIIYSKCPSVSCVRNGYIELDSKPSYAYFRQALNGKVEGTWDDHDYGLNDAGGNLKIRDESQTLLLDFLRIPKESPRRQRDGVYSGHRLVLESGRTARVLLLDTRKHRGPGFSPPVGEWQWLPGSSILAAGLRALSAYLGFGSDADILNEAQWQWLRSQFEGSNDDVHILVSSVQLTTTNPAFESWGHFPRSLQKLKTILIETKPRGLIIISGDVHFAQMLGNPSCVMEVTTSGMTHSVRDHMLQEQLLLRILEPLLGQKFDREITGGRRVFPGRNWASIDFASSAAGVSITANVMDIKTGEKVMQVTQEFNSEKVVDYNCLNEFEPNVRARTLLGRIAICVTLLSPVVAGYLVLLLIARQCFKKQIGRRKKQAGERGKKD